MSWRDRFSARFGTAFADRTLRTVGREAEHPVVHPDGTAADISVLWEDLSPGMQVKREGDLIVLLDGPDYAYSAEVGIGTVEIITQPQADLHALNACYEAARSRLLDATGKHGLELLGYGIQPLTPATLDLMSAKERYGVLLEVLGNPWLWFTLTASDQVHVTVGPSELIAQTNLANLLAPVAVALCANSPVYGGQDSGFASAREGRMGEIHAESFRHGMPEGPSPDLHDWISRLADQPWLMSRRADGPPVAETGSFAAWMDEKTRDEDEGWQAFLFHEHYIWNTARPRSAHGTLELRSAGQQPGDSHFAAAALSLGIVEAGAEIAGWLDEVLREEAWPTMRRWQHQTVRDGLCDPVPGLLSGILDLCRQGLERRGLGEEVYMEPLFARVAAGRNPAQESLAAFRAGGIEALVEHTRIRP